MTRRRSGSTPLGTDHRRARRCPATATADVAIAGGGYTGLWTAYYLAQRRAPVDDRGARGGVLPASAPPGRNGGWASGLFPVSEARLARRYGVGPRRRDAAGHWPARSTRWAGPRRPRESTATTPRAARSRWPARPAQLRRIRDAEGFVGRGDRPRDLRRDRRARRRLPPGLRRTAPGPAGPRPGRRRSRRRGVTDPRGHPGAADQPAARSSPTAAPSGPTRWCARWRATPPGWPDTAGRWPRSTR